MDLSQPEEDQTPEEEETLEYIDEPEFEETGEPDEELPLEETLLPEEEPLPEEPEPDEAMITEEEDEDPWAGVENPSIPELELEPEPEPEPRPAPKPQSEPPKAKRPEAVQEPEPKPVAVPEEPVEPEKPIDPFGEEAAKLYQYLKDLTRSLPPEKLEAMDKSGVSSKLDAIIDRVTKPAATPILPTEIQGVQISPRLAKLIEFMRREKHNAGK